MRSDERQPDPASAAARRPAASLRRRRGPVALRACVMLLATMGGALGLAAGADAQVKLPDFGDVSETTLSPADERALGEAFMREIRARLTLVDDPLVERYMQSLGYRLVASSDHRDLQFTFFMVEAPVAERVRGARRIHRRQHRHDPGHAVRERIRIGPRP